MIPARQKERKGTEANWTVTWVREKELRRTERESELELQLEKTNLGELNWNSSSDKKNWGELNCCESADVWTQTSYSYLCFDMISAFMNASYRKDTVLILCDVIYANFGTE